MLDVSAGNLIPHTFRVVFQSDNAAGAQAGKLAYRAVSHFTSHRKRMTHVSVTFRAMSATRAHAELQLGIPAQEFLLIIGKATRIEI
jgi:hypothetical protein